MPHSICTTMGDSNWSLQDNTDHGLFRLMEDTFIALLSVNSISTLALLATSEAGLRK